MVLIAHLRKQFKSINTYDYILTLIIVNVHFKKNLSPHYPRKFFCQSLLKLTQWFWRRRFSISSMYFCYFVIISPWKRAGPFIFEQSWFPITQGCSVLSWSKLAEWFRGRRWKFYDNKDNDDDGQRTNFDQKCSLEPSAQVMNLKGVLKIIHESLFYDLKYCYKSKYTTHYMINYGFVSQT